MITYFSVEWSNNRENRGKHSKSMFIVDSIHRRVTYVELTARGDVLLQQDGPLQASSGAIFFDKLSEIVNQWDNNVDFGGESGTEHWWKIKIRYKNGKIFRTKGNTHLPPSADLITLATNDLCSEAGLHMKDRPFALSTTL